MIDHTASQPRGEFSTADLKVEHFADRLVVHCRVLSLWCTSTFILVSQQLGRQCTVAAARRMYMFPSTWVRTYDEGRQLGPIPKVTQS